MPPGTQTGEDETGGKIRIPTFAGDQTHWKDYLRRVSAWRLGSNIKVEQQGLALYSELKGKAWEYTEDLDINI